MLGILKRVFVGSNNFATVVAPVNALETEIEKLTDEALKAKTLELKEQLAGGLTLEDIMPEAFALVREASRRTLKKRHFDVQLMGGAALHQGGIAEMLTGEGKTLVATLAAYLNALAGKGVHVVTVNEYLAKRDAIWMGQIYYALGLSVACLVHEGAGMYDPTFKAEKLEGSLIDKERDTTGSFLVQEEYFKPATRREAYAADITYGTNHEFGFDYLRDNLAYQLEGQVQRGHYYAIIDEADSILIDEARTPLIISVPDMQSSDFYKTFASVAKRLTKEEDYAVDEKMRTVAITELGIDKVEKITGIKNIYSPENFRLVHYLEESLKAAALFLRDRDYVVKNDEVIIVDQFTGRMMLGRRYSGGLHQAIEAKEGVHVREESQTYARISIQNYFRLYEKLAGMTGTAQTSAEEFHKVYGLEVISIPPNRPMVRNDMPDAIYRTLEEKYDAVVQSVKERYEKGQPVLLGTPSIEKNEQISALLTQAGVPHEVLNAKNNEREGAAIAQAGKMKAVMVATNMAGRGVDIILGGNPPDEASANKVREMGGLHVIGTDRHDARRIDNQLRGRSGRQGDPGSSQFFLSLEDDLMRIFGGDRVKGLMGSLNLPAGTPIESRFVSRAVSQAQAKVEGMNFDTRKHLLEYDDVLNKQRLGFYRKRQGFLTALSKEKLEELLGEAILAEIPKIVDQLYAAAESGEPNFDTFRLMVQETNIVKNNDSFKELVEKAKTLSSDEAKAELEGYLTESLRERIKDAANDPNTTPRVMGVLDMLWMSHLENMESLSESVRLRAYAQHDPLVEYRREGHRLYTELFESFSAWLFMNLFRGLSLSGGSQVTVQPAIAVPKQLDKRFDGVGRNDLCPCGSGKKFKKCHGQ